MTQLLLVEDNADYAHGLRSHLEVEGFEVELALDGVAGLERVRALQPAAVLLDLMVPLRDGYDVLRTMRSEGIMAPVLVLTARRDEQDRLRAFGLGADDYVTKPCGILELAARIRAVLRRSYVEDEMGPSWIRLDDIEIHPPTHAVRRSGQPVELTPKEYDLLIALLRRRGRAVSRAELFHEVWKQPGNDAACRTIDTHVLGLRRKLEADTRAPRLILTVQSVGYMVPRQ